jgi:hypothetical protein
MGRAPVVSVMNYSDLFVVLVLASGLYGLIVALARQRQFLTRAVNPYRGAWLLAGLTALWFGGGLLRLEAQSWDPQDWARVLRALVTDAHLSIQGKVATVAVLLGALLIVLVVWCRFNLPRDPTTFRRPQQRGKALRYYVTGLKGGLDYAVLMRPGAERLEESWEPRHILACLPQLPRVAGPTERVARTLDDQLGYWRQAAEKIHQSMPALDEVVAPAHQGANRRLVFDTEYGAMYFTYLRAPVPGAPDAEPVYLFAAALDQEAVNLKVADQHYDLLLRALRQIDTNIRVA